MKEMRLSSVCSSVLPLEYQEAGGDMLALPQGSSASTVESSSPVIVGVPEDEVERRVQKARDTATAEAGERMRIECERVSKGAQERVTRALKEFEDERVAYFRRAEGEIVQLALAIARKILHREAELDPTLLMALVRIALERMNCGSAVRIRVAAESADLWRGDGDANGSASLWDIVPDDRLGPGDCIVETELGTASFGFEAQLRDVEESFAQLLGHRPDTQARHAARV